MYSLAFAFMHIAIYAGLSVLLGSSLAAGLAAGTVSAFHLFGRRDSETMGVWTIPNALVVDMFFVNMAVAMFVWPLVGSVFIFVFKRGFISPFSLSEYAKSLAKDLPYTLCHTPIFSWREGAKSFSARSLQVMVSKAFLVACVFFTFIVMPTCTFITLHREQKISKLGAIPQNCAELRSVSLTGRPEPERVEIFESLCWDFLFTVKFAGIWGAAVGSLVSIASLFTAILQYAKAAKARND